MSVINFQNLSSNGATSLSWTFAGVGATPSTSTLSSPTVTVNTSGDLTATLTVTNPLGMDTYALVIPVEIYNNGAT